MTVDLIVIVGREGLTARASREEFPSEKKEGRPCQGAAAASVAVGGATIGGGDGNDGDGYGDGGGGSANRRAGNRAWRGWKHK